MRQQTLTLCTLLAVCAAAAQLHVAEAGQGCPFDDGSCQEYCSQQGCNMGYCGHFAWIQCICRKCGDEWGWYDKVRYNPDKTVNQTELDSLKLNGTAPLILTNASANATAAAAKGSVRSTGPLTGKQAEQQQQQQAGAKKPATLTTLLIPDLTDSNKLDLNDIPDENSDKFLDYLAKNHEKLVQATSVRAGDPTQQTTSTQASESTEEEPSEETEEAEEQANGSAATTSSQADDDTIEIQISTNNNNQKPEQTSAQTTTSSPSASSTESQLKRLLKVAVVERDSEEIVA